MHKGQPCSPETRAKISAKMRGRKATPEAIEINRLSHLGKLSPEMQEKMRLGRIGRHLSPACIEKLRQANMGCKNPHYGKSHSPEARQKIALGNRGKKHSAETRAKMSASAMGIKKALGYHHTPATRANMSRARIGMKLSAEHRKNIGLAQRGENSRFWHGGISRTPYAPGFTLSLKRDIRARDGFACFVCGIGENGIAHDVHHIDYSKTNHSQSNLITLCEPCHIRTRFNRESWLISFGKENPLRVRQVEFERRHEPDQGEA